MKKPLVDLVSKPGLSDGLTNLIRGVLALIVGCFLGYGNFYGVAELYQLDIDGKVGVGRVTSMKENVTRSRKRRISMVTSYTLNLATQHGVILISSDTYVHPGERVRYIYSPTSHVAKLAPEPLGRGDMVWNKLYSFGSLGWIVLVSAMFYYAYNQLWWFYVFISGRYTINGMRVGESGSPPIL